jgi:outer membrane protein OmpA-like peptidoglycan-associated protein
VTVPDLTPEVNPGDTTVETLTANEPVTWSITSGADKNKFQINSSTGALEFKDPAEPGTYTVVVTATDASGNKTNKTITVTVPNAPVAPTITIPSPLNVLEFSTGDFSLLTSNQEVDWEIVTTSGINVTIVNGQLHFDGTFWNEHDGQTITVRATNPDTGLVTTKVITLNVVPVTVSASGSVNSSGNGSYTISTSNPLLDENDMVLDNVDNPNVTNVAYVNGVLTFDVDPNYTGTAVFTFCAAPGEGCLSYKTITLHLGAVSAPASATRYVVSPTKTTITWSAATNAARYVVKLNGKVICRTSGTICNYKGLIGPKQRVTVTAYGNNGSTAVITVKQSKSRFGLVGRVTNFAINSANLDWKKKYQLMVLARKLKAAGFTTIRIVGNTDDIGSLLVDMGLSKARANAVKLHLAFYLKGVKFVIEAKGRTNPIRSNTNGDNRKYNRRVDIYAA